MFHRRVVPCFLAVLLATPGFARAATGTATLDADVWSRPRNGAEFARMPALRDLVDVYERQPDGRIVVHHGGGDEASLWAEETRYWLVALGIPAARVRLVLDPAVTDGIQLEVRAYGGDN